MTAVDDIVRRNVHLYQQGFGVIPMIRVEVGEHIARFEFSHTNRPHNTLTRSYALGRLGITADQVEDTVYAACKPRGLLPFNLSFRERSAYD